MTRALGRQIAESLNKPLLLRNASDLLGKYVGENEKNIAQAFLEARQQNAVLMMDEVDSFLADRRRANAQWEVTAVNEMLTQMESFDSIVFTRWLMRLICANASSKS